jgi:type IV pilus assembly protein PilQ
VSKRFYLAAGFALSVLSVTPAVSHAQAKRQITVEYQNARLSQVVKAFATFSGRTIELAPNVGDADVTVSFANVDWQVALDSILEKESLVARVDPGTGVMRIEKRTPG